MAWGGPGKPVLLGFSDEYAASDRENFYTNKVHPYYFCPLDTATYKCIPSDYWPTTAANLGFVNFIEGDFWLSCKTKRYNCIWN